MSWCWGTGTLSLGSGMAGAWCAAVNMYRSAPAQASPHPPSATAPVFLALHKVPYTWRVHTNMWLAWGRAPVSCQHALPTRPPVTPGYPYVGFRVLWLLCCRAAGGQGRGRGREAPAAAARARGAARGAGQGEVRQGQGGGGGARTPRTMPACQCAFGAPCSSERWVQDCTCAFLHSHLQAALSSRLLCPSRAQVQG